MKPPSFFGLIVSLYVIVSIVALALVFGGYITGYNRGQYNGCVLAGGKDCRE